MRTDPAVTLGMVLIRALPPFRGALLFATQLLGGITAAALTQALFPGDLNVSTTRSSTTSIAQGVCIEMILTMQLVFTIFMLAAEKHRGTFIAPVGIGLSLFVAELVGESSYRPSYPIPSSFGPLYLRDQSTANASQVSSIQEAPSTQRAPLVLQSSPARLQAITGSTGLAHLLELTWLFCCIA